MTTDQDDEFASIEVDRRLDTLLSRWPFLRDEPDKWHIVASWLVSDPEIWGVIAKWSSARPAGAPKKAAGASKYPLDKIADLARAFGCFQEREKARCSKSGLPDPNKDALIKRFREKEGARFPWLPEKNSTVRKIIGQGERALDFPIVQVGGRRQRMHPDAASAYTEFRSQAQGETAAEVAALRPDRAGDLKKMADAKMLATLRGHAIRSVLGISETPGLKPKIRD